MINAVFLTINNLEFISVFTTVFYLHNNTDLHLDITRARRASATSVEKERKKQKIEALHIVARAENIHALYIQVSHSAHVVCSVGLHA